jgi:hypothetical protein
VFIATPQTNQRLIRWLWVRRWLVGQPQRPASGFTFPVCFHQQKAEHRVRILASVEAIPTSKTHLAPLLVFQFHRLLGLAPGLRLLEGKPVAVHARTTMTTVLAGRLVQHPITAHPGQDATRFLFQRPEKGVVAVLAIGYDEVKRLEHLGPPVTTQLLDLIHAYLDIGLLAWNPADRQRRCPTGISLWCPGQH